MSEIFAVIGTLSGTVLGVFLTKLIEWFNKPRLEIMFEHEEPCLFLGRYLRLKVVNKGKSVAKTAGLSSASQRLIERIGEKVKCLTGPGMILSLMGKILRGLMKYMPLSP